MSKETNAYSNLNSAAFNGVLSETDQNIQTAMETLDNHTHTLVDEDVQDIVGAMVTGNTETGIAVTYDDANNKLNFDAQTAGDARYAPIAKGVTNGDSHDHSGGDGAQIAYSSLSGLPTLGSIADNAESDFAVASKGVTNGDSHDHNGGDGAQIAHTSLSSIGTNTHAQIDTHISTGAHVTNGDSHDHSGGDGAQIDHTTLSNIGTNTHAQIDTHIALRRWTTIVKTADESVQSDTSLTADTDLIFTMTASKKYVIRGKIWYTTPAAADFKFRTRSGGTPTAFWVKYMHQAPLTTTLTQAAMDIASPGTTVSLTTAGAVTDPGYIEFEARVEKEAANGSFTFDWAQVTSTASNTTVKAGSYIEYMEI